MLLIPFRIETLPVERPWANWAFVSACVVLSVAALGDALPQPMIEAMITDGWNPLGLVGHLFLHANISHLAGNMLFLWIFGNAVCGMVGNKIYLAAFPLCGVLAALFHNLLLGGPMIGASGAINGVIGFVLAICPVNRVTLFYWVVIRFGNITLPAWVIILFWFGFDVYGAVKGTGMVAYWAHIGGFASGLAIGWFVLSRKWMVLTQWDGPTLLELLRGPRTYPEPAPLIVESEK